jgi:hypothetical protein
MIGEIMKKLFLLSIIFLAGCLLNGNAIGSGGQCDLPLNG